MWLCASCGGTVTDIGPQHDDPSKNETGHADFCERFNHEVEGWKRFNQMSSAQ